jgi:predicted metal-dependent HD superfamily phosphohydrolase
MNQDYLEHQWCNLLVDTGLVESAVSQRCFVELCNAYRETHRHYHTLAHISQMLRLLSDAQVVDPVARWATWYHDVIYSPGKQENEKLSADIAEARLISLGVEHSLAERVARIILATRHHQASADAIDTLKYVLDADMAILGVSDQHYQQYCEVVHREFKLVPTFLYKRGRKKFLKSVLQQERIYSMPWFYHQFEQQARKNMERELTRL